MSLKKYIEMMTSSERSKAMSQGQSSLKGSNDILDDTKPTHKEYTDEEAKAIAGIFYTKTLSPMENIERFRTRMSKYKTVSFLIDNEPKRIIYRNKKIYWDYAENTTHQRILSSMYLNGIPLPIDSFQRWHYNTQYIKEYLCLYLGSGKRLYLAESYETELIWWAKDEIKECRKDLQDQYNIKLLGEMPDNMRFAFNR